MTSYHGGKQRIGKSLAEFIVDESLNIEDETDFIIKGYCEPFCGMLGVYQHIPELFKEEGIKGLKYKAGDLNKSVIKMWKDSQKGWKAPTKCLSKEKWEKLKYGNKTSALKGFVGHLQSFRSLYFAGYANHITDARCKATSKKVSDIATKPKRVSFKNGEYPLTS